MQCIATLVIAAALVGGPVCLSADHGIGQAEVSAPARTGKERLTDKGSDEQRVDDCKVPAGRRTRPRPTDCQVR
jgi:hypothetical protein